MTRSQMTSQELVHPLRLCHISLANFPELQAMTASHARATDSQTLPEDASLFGAPWKQAVVGVVLAAWFYFIGWVYTYFYFRFFHIDIFELDIPLEYIVVQATTPVEFAFWNYWPYLAGIIALSIIGFVYVRHSPQRHAVCLNGFIRRHWRTLGFPCAVGAAVALYIVGFQIAALAATNRAQEVWTSDAPEIQFSFADDEKGSIEHSKLSELNDNFGLRYLLATKDFYYVFIAEKMQTSNYIPDGLVFKVRSDAVDYVWIRRRGGSINAM
jgi:hypothetical protein